MSPNDETPQDPQNREPEESAGAEEPTREQPGADGPQAGAEEPTRQQPGADGPQAAADDAPTQPLGGGGQEPRRLVRSRTDRVVGGVAAGVAKYFNIDPVIVRVVFVALTFLGGAGILLYLAALLLVPDDRGHVAADASSFRGKMLIAVAGVLLFVAIGAAVPWGWDNWFLGGFLFPLAFLALLGLGTWWLVQGKGDSSGTTSVGGILRAVVFGLMLLAGCFVLALGSGWAAAVGGGGVVASLVVAAGALLVAGAFVARVRWLILPALAIALPLAVVSAAGIDMDGSVGERDYRPLAAADIHDRYEVGVGQLIVDLRDTDLGPGEHHVDMKVGVGEAVLLVPDDVCVASAAELGLGAVTVFDRDTGGVDVSWEDDRTASSETPVVIVDADIGIGHFEVANQLSRDHHGWDRFDEDDRDTSTGAGLAACADRA